MISKRPDTRTPTERANDRDALLALGGVLFILLMMFLFRSRLS